MERGLIASKIRDAGVVGAGGAGFPTHLKAAGTVQTVIANGAECEPLLQVDQQLMTFFPEKVLSGLRYLIKATRAEAGILALKKKYKTALESLKKNIRPSEQISIKILESFYPAGDEHQLVYQATGRTVPEGGLPPQVGVLVENIGTLCGIDDALRDRPVVDKYVTVTGEVEKPRTYRASIGTLFSDLIRLSRPGIRDFSVINGGPLMGISADLKNGVVTKTTSGLILLPAAHPLIRKKNENIKRSLKLAKTLCIQCNTCTENCPRNGLGHNLRPHLLMRKIALNAGAIDESFSDAGLCCGCGICSFYSCPMDLSPLKVIQAIKSVLSKKKLPLPAGDKTPSPGRFYYEKLIPTERIIARLNLLKYSALKAPMLRSPYEPSRVRIPLSQHIGAPSLPVVREGEKVQKYGLIADIPEGKTGARIHASIPGTVTVITKNYIEIKK